MQLFIAAGYSRADLARLNCVRVRCYQQVNFLSEVLGASGKLLDVRYLKKRPADAQWSRLNFGNECPPRKDFKFWAQASARALLPQGV